MLPKEAMMVEGKMMSVEEMQALAEDLPVGIVKVGRWILPSFDPVH